MEPAIFLDRDNTLITNDGDLGDPEAVDLLDGVPDGLRSLRDAGYRLIVVTNQGGVARGVFTEEDVDAVHRRIAGLVDDAAGVRDVIDRFYYCPYHPDAKLEEYRRDHSWRKPQPGMLLQAARDMKIDLARSWMIGDQARDIEAGHHAGCRTVLLAANGEANGTSATTVADSFPAAVRAILKSKPAPASSESPRGGGSSSGRASTLERSVVELTEELRVARLRRAEFTPLRLAAGLAQLLALLLAALAIPQSGSDAFLKWILAAIFVELVVAVLLLVDQR